MRWRTMLVACLAGGLLSAGPALAQAEALKVIPGDALGFGLVKRIDQASGKIHILTKRMQLPIPFAPLQLLKVVGVQSLNEKATAAVAIVPGPQEDSEPVAILFVPVTNYKNFIQPFKPKDATAKTTTITVHDHELVVGKKGAFAAITDSRHEETLKKALASQTSIADAVEPLQTILGENDVTGVVTTNGIKTITSKGREGLAKAKEIIGALGAPEIAGTMIDGVDKFLATVSTEVPYIVAGAKVDASGNIHMSLQALFAKGGRFAKGAGKIEAPEGSPIAGLPARPFVLAGGGAFPQAWMQKLTGIGMEIIKSVAKDLPEEKLKKLDQAYSQMYKGVRSMAMEFSVGKAGEPLFGNMIGILKVDDASAFLARYEKSMRTMNEMIKDLNIPFAQPAEIKKVKISGAHGLEIINDLGGNPAAALVGEKNMEHIFGKGGKLTVTIAAANDDTVVMRYTPPSGLKGILQAIKNGSPSLAEDADVAKTAALLPKGSQWVSFVSPKGVVDLANRGIMDFAPQIGLQIPAFPQTPPVGGAIKLTAAGFEAHLVVHAGILDGIGEILPQLMKLRAAENQ